MNKPDNICRLKYRLEEKENGTVEFQILEQDEKLRNNTGRNHLLIKSKGWEVCSWHAPEVRVVHKNVFIRGSWEIHDEGVVFFTGPEYIPSIHKALEEMVKKVFGNCTVIKS